VRLRTRVRFPPPPTLPRRLRRRRSLRGGNSRFPREAPFPGSIVRGRCVPRPPCRSRRRGRPARASGTRRGEQYRGARLLRVGPGRSPQCLRDGYLRPDPRGDARQAAGRGDPQGPPAASSAPTCSARRRGAGRRSSSSSGAAAHQRYRRAASGVAFPWMGSRMLSSGTGPGIRASATSIPRRAWTRSTSRRLASDDYGLKRPCAGSIPPPPPVPNRFALLHRA
jgi:hypothetical protein